jgi:hypothetical protein
MARAPETSAMPLFDPTIHRLRCYDPTQHAARAALRPGTSALPDEDGAEWDALLEGYLADFTPETTAARALVEQLAQADVDRRRCLRARAARVTERVRTAEFDFDRRQDDDVEAARRLLPKDPQAALYALNRTAAGT